MTSGVRRLILVMVAAVGVCLLVAFGLPSSVFGLPGVALHYTHLPSLRNGADMSITQHHKAALDVEGLALAPSGLAEQNRMLELRTAHIVPDVADDVNRSGGVAITVEYGSSVVQGQRLSPAATKEQPQVHIRGQGLFTLVMSDPDAPTPDKPTNREWLHWLVTNLPEGTYSSAEAIKKHAAAIPMEYAGPTPPQGSPPHRYIFTLFEQHEDKPIDVHAPSDRPKFHTKEFAKEHSLGHPVDVVYFTAEKEGST